LGKLKDMRTDPLNHEIKLDTFNQYHLESNLYYFEKGLQRILIREYGNTVLSDLSYFDQVNSYEQEMEVQDMQDCLDDERCR
jgi:hypothetical protein